MRVEAYYNLKTKTPSVRALEGEGKGRVIDHPERVYLAAAKFVVQEGGRQRVIREKQKNVHAFVRGWTCENPPTPARKHRVIYNPFKYDSFRYADNPSQPVESAEFVEISTEGCFVLTHPRET